MAPPPRDNAAFFRAFKEHEKEDDERHEANLEKFAALEVKAATIAAQMKIVIGLLLVNGGVNIFQALQYRK